MTGNKQHATHDTYGIFSLFFLSGFVCFVIGTRQKIQCLLYVGFFSCLLLAVFVDFLSMMSIPAMSVFLPFCLSLSISVNFRPFYSILFVSACFCTLLSVSVCLGLLLVLVQLSAHIERFSVSIMQ